MNLLSKADIAPLLYSPVVKYTIIGFKQGEHQRLLFLYSPHMKAISVLLYPNYSEDVYNLNVL
jgi:hypothetical protein